MQILNVHQRKLQHVVTNNFVITYVSILARTLTLHASQEIDETERTISFSLMQKKTSTAKLKQTTVFNFKING
jgi:hypothetical protein